MARALYISMEDATMENAMLTPSKALALATESAKIWADGRAAWNGLFEDDQQLVGRNEIRIWLLEALDAKLSACRNSAEVYAAVDPLLVECLDIIEDIFVETSRVTACHNS